MKSPKNTRKNKEGNQVCIICEKPIEHEPEYLLRSQGFAHFNCLDNLEEEK